MKRVINNILIFSFVISLFAVGYFFYWRTKKMDEKINSNGLYAIGIINKRRAAKGTTSIGYTYEIGHKKIKYERYVSKNFFGIININDTIIIKFLPTDLNKSLICEKIKYKACFGKQPINGWKDLPQCN